MGFATSFVKVAIMSFKLTHRGSPQTSQEYLSSSKLLHLKEHIGPVLGSSTVISGKKNPCYVSYVLGTFHPRCSFRRAMSFQFFNRAIPCTTPLDWSPWEATETGAQHLQPFYVCRSLNVLPMEMQPHSMNISLLKAGWVYFCRSFRVIL